MGERIEAMEFNFKDAEPNDLFKPKYKLSISPKIGGNDREEETCTPPDNRDSTEK